MGQPAVGEHTAPGRAARTDTHSAPRRARPARLPARPHRWSCSRRGGHGGVQHLDGEDERRGEPASGTSRSWSELACVPHDTLEPGRHRHRLRRHRQQQVPALMNPSGMRTSLHSPPGPHLHHGTGGRLVEVLLQVGGPNRVSPTRPRAHRCRTTLRSCPGSPRRPSGVEISLTIRRPSPAGLESPPWARAAPGCRRPPPRARVRRARPTVTVKGVRACTTVLVATSPTAVADSRQCGFDAELLHHELTPASPTAV